MTTEHDLTHPICFDSIEEYRDWVVAARKVRGIASPCDDCTTVHRDRMGVMRCQEPIVRTIFIVNYRAPKRAF